MNHLAQQAVLVGLARRLQKKGSWTGETHLQKAAYLLSELRDIDFDFGFILYKHGPFSFELRDELAHMRIDGLIENVIENPRYGPKLKPTKLGRELEKQLKRVAKRYSESLDWIADTLGKRGVVELECLATAMWVTRKEGGSVSERVKAVVRIKPHIERKAAAAAVEEIDDLLGQSA
jgi:uncharacterized protein YwgA